MPLLRAAIVAGLGLMLAPASARELASAPEIDVIGFSRDGRLFAYEQFLNDEVSAEVIAAIDVVERDGGGSAKGFPFGFLGVPKAGEFPRRVGGHRIKKNDNDAVPGEKKLADLRAAIRRETAARLKALKIGERGRRLAGSPVTERSGAGPVDFVLGATLPGPVPDMQPVYRVSASFAPQDTEKCVNGEKPADHTITLQIDERHPQNDTVQSTSKAEIAWPAGEGECASALRITDVIEAPGQKADKPRHVVVMVLAVSWGGHAEGSRMFARFVKLP